MRNPYPLSMSLNRQLILLNLMETIWRYLSKFYIFLCLIKRSRTCIQFCFLCSSSSYYTTFLLSVDSHQTPQGHTEALLIPKLKSVIDEISNLVSYHTWDLVNLQLGTIIVGCWWVYIVKHFPNGFIDTELCSF